MWQVVQSVDHRGEEVIGKWEIIDSERNPITEFAFLDIEIAERITNRHNIEMKENC